MGFVVILVTIVGGGIVLAGVFQRILERMRTDSKIASACAEVRVETGDVRRELRDELMSEIAGVRQEIAGVRQEMREARIGFGR